MPTQQTDDERDPTPRLRAGWLIAAILLFPVVIYLLFVFFVRVIPIKGWEAY